jgi:hypothetical protein
MDRLRKKTLQRWSRTSTYQDDEVQSKEETITIHGPLWKWDWVSKLRDGLLPALVLVLLVIVLSLLIPPIQEFLHRPGLLVYMLILLTLGVVFLASALHEDQPITRRAWYGLAGGMITWMATEVTDRLSSSGLTSINAVPYFLIIGLFVTILWRRVLPLPVRWFILVFFLNWVSRFIVAGEQTLVVYFPQANLVYLVTALLGIAGIVTSLLFITWRSRERVQRMRMAVWLWFSTLVVLEVLVAVYL